MSSANFIRSSVLGTSPCAIAAFIALVIPGIEAKPASNELVAIAPAIALGVDTVGVEG